MEKLGLTMQNLSISLKLQVMLCFVARHIIRSSLEGSCRSPNNRLINTVSPNPMENVDY